MLKNIIFFILMLFSYNCYSQYDFNTNCINAYEKIICLNFDEAKVLLDKESKINNKNIIPAFLNSYIDFLTTILGEDLSAFNNFKNSKAIRLEILEEGDKKSPFYRYCLADVYLQYAFARLKFNEYLTAAYEINKAYRLLTENQTLYPKFLPNLKSLGLLHALIGSIPENYNWTKKVIGVEGSIEQGIKELNTVINIPATNNSYSYLNSECLFYLSFIQLNLQSKPENANNLDRKFIKLKNTSNSQLMLFSRVCIAMNNGNNDYAISLLESRPVADNQYKFCHLDFLFGLAKLQRLDKDALLYFYKYILCFKGKSYLKSTYQKIAWIYLLNGDIAKYKENMNYVLKYGNLDVDDDIQAQKEAENNVIPNIFLLKSRLLFDGGYYEKALKTLVDIKPSEVFTDEKDFIEYTYRLARIYHKLNNNEKALKFYDLTIQKGADKKYYFAANSALQIATIYENLNNFDKALKYYQQCLNFKNDEYKNSIDQKAQAGINRLKSRKN